MRPAVLAAGLVAALPWIAGAADAPAPVPPLGAGNMLQVLLGLGVVLALLLGGAYAMRRFGRLPGLSNQAIKTIAAASVGTRERVVLLEVSGQWVLVGVAPGQVRALATLPRGELPQEAAALPAHAPFAQILQRLSERRNGKS